MMEGEGQTEFQDWELLVNSDTEVVNSPTSVDNPRNFEEMEADSEGVIRLDYFSLENGDRFAGTVVDGASEESSVESDNPCWIDPGTEAQRFHGRNSAELWSDSGSDRSDERKFGDFDVRNKLGFVEKGTTVVGVGELVDNKGEVEAFEGQICGSDAKSEVGFDENLKNHMDCKGLDDSPNKKDLAEFWSGSGGDSSIFGEVEKINEMSEAAAEADGGNGLEEENLGAIQVKEMKTGSDEEKRKVVWWKVPLELLKYCVFRVSPVWSFSMAAAVMGFVILGRRLYKMKRKTQSLQLKVTVDDKKVSQVMSRVARLNEAFSVVKRVPIVRPLLPAAGVNPWPVMSLR